MPALILHGLRFEAPRDRIILARPILVVPDDPNDGGCSTAVYLRPLPDETERVLGRRGEWGESAPPTLGLVSLPALWKALAGATSDRAAPWARAQPAHAGVTVARVANDGPPRALTPVRVDTLRLVAKPKRRIHPFRLDRSMLALIDEADERAKTTRTETFVDLPGLGKYKYRRISTKGEHYPIRFFSDAVTFALNTKSGATYVDLKSIALWTAAPLSEVIGAFVAPWSELVWGWARSQERHLTRYVADRLDLCRDFQCLGFAADEIRKFTTRARKREHVQDAVARDGAHHVAMVDGNALRTLYLGKGSPIMLRSYDKTAQITASRGSGEHYRAVWSGFDPDDGPVRRVEYQLTGEEALATWKGLDVRSMSVWLDDARSSGAIDRLWSYLTGEWAVLRRPADSDSNLSRAPVDPRWTVVQNIGRNATAARDMSAVRARVRDDLLRRRIDLAHAYLASFAALFEPSTPHATDADFLDWAVDLLKRAYVWRSHELRFATDELVKRTHEKRLHLMTVHLVPPLRG